MEIGKALTIMDRVSATREKLAQLDLELRRSLTLIEEFGGSVFLNGSVKTQVIGNPRNALVFTLDTGGVTISRDLVTLPVILWPKQVVADIKQCYGLQSPYLRQLKDKLKEYENDTGRHIKAMDS